MLVIKLTERPDGTIVAETRNAVLGTFPMANRRDVVRYLEHKARECEEEIRFVTDFDDYDDNEHVNFKKMMRRRF